MTRLRTAILVPAAAVALGLAACSSGGSSGTAAPAATTPAAAPATTATTPAPSQVSSATITIQSFAFGAPLTVTPGEKVTVVNKDSAPHTVTANNKSFDVSVDPGGSGTFTAPTTPGSYAYICTVHPYMHGTLIVKA